MHEADAYSLGIEGAAGGIEELTSGRPAKRHAGFRIRLTTTIIGAASVVVAAVGLIPPFVGIFWIPDLSNSKIDHRSTAPCVKIGNMNISFTNGIPEVVARIRVGVEVHTTDQGYEYLLELMLVLTDGSVHAEERRIKKIPDVVVFPLDFLPYPKRDNLMVDVDLAGATDVPVGACS